MYVTIFGASAGLGVLLGHYTLHAIMNQTVNQPLATLTTFILAFGKIYGASDPFYDSKQLKPQQYSGTEPERGIILTPRGRDERGMWGFYLICFACGLMLLMFNSPGLH